MAEMVVKYVGHKVSKVRWRPQISGSIDAADTFASGSYDDMVNHVCIWKLPAMHIAEDVEGAGIPEPELVCEQTDPADILDLVFLNRDQLACAFSNGNVKLFGYKETRKELYLLHEWKEVHHEGIMPSPCTALGVIAASSNVFSGGEDGSLNMLRLEDPRPYITVRGADSSTVTGLDCTIPSEVLVSSSNGQLKVWDFRKPPTKPTRVLSIESSDYISVHGVNRHPAQPNLVVLGCSNGSLCFWDLRQEKMPASLYHAHTSDVWEARFHHSYPDHLYTCCQDGALWHWNASSVAVDQDIGTVQSRKSPWLSGAIACGKVDIVNQLPQNTMSVNSCDIEASHLVCGSDGEAIFVITDTNFR